MHPTNTNFTFAILLSGTKFSDVKSVTFTINALGTAAVREIQNLSFVDKEAPFTFGGGSNDSLIACGIESSGLYFVKYELYSLTSSNPVISETIALNINLTASENISISNFKEGDKSSTARTVSYGISGTIVIAILMTFLIAMWMDSYSAASLNSESAMKVKATFFELVYMIQTYAALLFVNGTLPEYFRETLTGLLWTLGIVKVEWITQHAETLATAPTCSSLESDSKNISGIFKALTSLGVPVCGVFFTVFAIFLLSFAFILLAFGLAYMLKYFSRKSSSPIFANKSLEPLFLKAVILLLKVFYFPIVLSAVFQLSLPVHTVSLDLLASLCLLLIGVVFVLFGAFKVYPFIVLSDSDRQRLLDRFGGYFSEFQKPEYRLFFLVVFVRSLCQGLALCLLRDGAVWIQSGLSVLIPLCVLLLVIALSPYADHLESRMVSSVMLLEVFQSVLSIPSLSSISAVSIISLVLTCSTAMLLCALAILRVIRATRSKHQQKEQKKEDAMLEDDGRDLVVHPASDLEVEA
jgi:hypothetical protein